jgi:hypothetical protein
VSHNPWLNATGALDNKAKNMADTKIEIEVIAYKP